MDKASTPTQFNSFAEFYPYYLAEHANRTCRLPTLKALQALVPKGL